MWKLRRYYDPQWKHWRIYSNRQEFHREWITKKKPCDDVIGKSNSDEETIESESKHKINNEKNIPGNSPSGKNTITEEPTLKHSLDKCYSEQLSQVSLKNAFKKIYLLFTIIILTILKLLWDAIDVTIDAYLFYQLETGRVIDKDIYRNKHVNNAILAFSMLGCLKLLFWIRFIGIYRVLRMRNETWKHKNLATLKFLSAIKLYFEASTFLFEDGPELILEYFYVEKYMSIQPAWYLFVRDIILCVISLYTIIVSSTSLVSRVIRFRDNYAGMKWKNKCSKICETAVNIGSNVLIGLLLFMRVGGAGYQYVTGKLRRSCFIVDDGALIQTPFTFGCMREVDYFIIVLSGFAITCSILALFTVNHALGVINYPYSGRKSPYFWKLGYYKFC